MKARAIIPWVENDNAYRLRNRDAVVEHLDCTGIFAVGAVIVADTIGEARNAGAWNAPEDVFVLNDADTICPDTQVRDAVRLAAEAPGLVFAYDLYVRLDQTHSESLAAAIPIEKTSELWFEWTAQQVFHNSGSMGCVAISRESFERVGGFDESYVGWGYEDLDFARRCGELWPIRRVSGPVYHLWHGDRRDDDSPLDSDHERVLANADRFHVKT